MAVELTGTPITKHFSCVCNGLFFRLLIPVATQKHEKSNNLIIIIGETP